MGRCRRTRALPSHSAEQLVATGDRLIACVHQHEASRAVGVFGHAWCKASLTKQGRLLIARPASYWDAGTQPGAHRFRPTGHKKARYGATQHAGMFSSASMSSSQVPLFRFIKQGAGGVAGLGGMHPSARELPQQPTVHRSESQFAALGPRSDTRHMVQQPRQFGARKIGIHAPIRFWLRSAGAWPADAQFMRKTPRCAGPARRWLAPPARPVFGDPTAPWFRAGW